MDGSCDDGRWERRKTDEGWEEGQQGSGYRVKGLKGFTSYGFAPMSNWLTLRGAQKRAYGTGSLSNFTGRRLHVAPGLYGTNFCLYLDVARSCWSVSGWMSIRPQIEVTKNRCVHYPLIDVHRRAK